jgi:hypothetical protein
MKIHRRCEKTIESIAQPCFPDGRDSFAPRKDRVVGEHGVTPVMIIHTPRDPVRGR